MSNYEIKRPASYMSPTAPQIRMTKHLQEEWGSLPENPQVNLKDVSQGYSQITEELIELKEIENRLTDDSSYTIEQAEIDLRDVCVDLTVFLQQLMVRTGIDQKVNSDFYEIYLNNLTKVCWSEEHASDTCVWYLADQDIECDYRQVKDHWVVYRVSDGKIMKPLGFKGVEL